MAREQIVVGLDIGTQFIRTTIGQLIPDESEPSILGIGVAPSHGLRRGNVVNVDDTVKAISASLEEAERVAGISVNNAYVNVTGSHIESQNSQGVVAVSRADTEIGPEDADRAMEAAKAVAVPPNKEILHAVAREFVVDGQEGIKDPIGMNGIRLEVETHVISASSPTLKNLSKCVYQAGIDVEELVFTGLADGVGALSKRQKELGVAILNIGSGVSELAVFEEGDIFHTAVIPVGGGHVTNDIAIGLRTDTDVAERVKLEYGYAVPKDVRDKEEVDMGPLAGGEEHRVSKRLIAEIIEARVLEIFTLAQKELRKVGREGKLPAGIILVGGGAKLPGIVELAKDALRLPAQVGFPRELKGMVDKADDPSFVTSLGLMLWGFAQDGNRTSKRFSGLPGGEYLDKVKTVVKQFLP